MEAQLRTSLKSLGIIYPRCTWEGRGMVSGCLNWAPWCRELLVSCRDFRPLWQIFAPEFVSLFSDPSYRKKIQIENDALKLVIARTLNRHISMLCILTKKIRRDLWLTVSNSDEKKQNRSLNNCDKFTRGNVSNLLGLQDLCCFFGKKFHK